MESEGGTESNNPPISLPEVIVREGDPDSGVKSGSSTPSSSSSSSDSSFVETFFEDDGNDGNDEKKPNAVGASSPNSSVDDPEPASTDEKEIEFYTDSSPSPISAATASPTDQPESSSSQKNELLTQSPPPQVMARPAEDASPYRIPSSVFARSKSTTPMEWSVASNESLFSIHMGGNSSFSRDHMFLMDRDFGKSGELLYSNGSSPPIRTPEPERNSDLVEADIDVTAAAAETMKEVLRVAAEEHRKDKQAEPVGGRHSPSASRNSDASGTSVRSFAFPILTGEGGKSGSGKGESRHLEKQQSPKSPPSAPANAGESKWWCSWFSCCCRPCC